MGKEIYHAKKDPKYQKPYVDVDELRDRVLADGRVLAYRYVHGGFEDTNVKFSFCFPMLYLIIIKSLWIIYLFLNNRSQR